MPTSSKLSVFLCHAKEDKPAVRELYQKLAAEGWIDPWLDEEKLYPGQDWNLEIEKAVGAADAIIVCLSKSSITKEGYVQRELRIVLDYADYKPEGTLYIIPVRLEDCEPPRRLRPWQYADYFPNDQRGRAYQRLLTSLQMRASGLGIKPEKPQPQPGSVKREEKPKLEPAGPAEKTKIGLTEAPPKPANLQHANVQLANPSISLRASSQLENRQVWGGLEFVRIPAGKFLMGSKEDNELAFSGERPQHTVDLPYDYWMAKFPVTNEQYAGFKRKGQENKKNHPVVNVSWEDATDYYRWLNNLLKGQLPDGFILRLPTEAEWEKAARGVDGREWPWGNEFDQNKCNSSEGGKGGTTPVDLYSPQGDSPYGCADVAGNVWEWTSTLFKSYPYKYNDGREKETVSGSHALRGGSFYDDIRLVRCAYRNFLNPGNRYGSFGFRVCVSPVSLQL